jgi:hypothetical protein
MEQLKVGTNELPSVVKKNVVAASGVVHGGIPHGRACPPAGGAHDGGG